MTTTLATSLDGKFDLITNGNHSYWTLPTTGAFRGRYKEFAGNTLATAIKSLTARAMVGC